ncbi:GIY-YIG nuclease family protein [Aquimarina sp. ERC-38]|uniref:GIY-YIG nuclease family protein n=1 Tax=Aquimarina sp. ERC-38 TaxID=2949996 RepID=UPI0022482E90|nr:GIY-YIG nuclease family protein [Aquimarina sp. ERC-38]UZO79590.1 GIY-YIG nuclease family protein [Aquimarina sp. ERC-38]
MEEFVVYVLYSEKYRKHYTGFTTSLIERFKSHNKLTTKGWTIRYRPWKVVYIEFCNSKQEALSREKFLKSDSGRRWLKDKLIY